MTGLAVRGVTVAAGGKAILADVGFAAAAGQVTGLIGPNGAGKSTLLAAIQGLHTLSAGSIMFDGTDLPGMAAPDRGKLCAYVEQFASTPERLTVGDVVALGRLPFQSVWQSHGTPQDDAIVTGALADLGLTGFAGRLYHTLSGGEQQRVQIARALAQQPRLLLLDEPTSHLDIAAKLNVLDTLAQRAKAGCTVVVALHDLNLAARYCDRLIVLNAGRVVAEGTPSDVLAPELLLRVYRVKAEIVRLLGRAHPVVFYDSANP